MKINELSDKQRAFCREYAFDWNGTRAYMKAYHVTNENTAKVNASKLLTNTNVQRQINYFRDHTEETANISKLKLLTELKKVAMSSIGYLHDSWITLKEFEQLTDDQKACIQSIESKTRTEKRNGAPVRVDYVKIKLLDKLAAIESINRMLAYNSAEKVDVTNSDNSLRELSTEELTKRAMVVKSIVEGKKGV